MARAGVACVLRLEVTYAHLTACIQGREKKQVRGQVDHEQFEGV